MKALILISLVALAATEDQTVDIVDPNGYVMFCPCMGRFGNQADHYLGALAFAKGINRTLVLPPFVEYKPGQRRSIQVPFNTYFQVEAIKSYHDRVITMEEFFRSPTLSEVVWPKEKRISFCYSARQPGPNHSEEDNRGGVCYAKSGNPFGPFWDTFSINFVGSKTYGPDLHYDIHHPGVAEEWMRKFPGKNWPVLAFTGAPASFPVQEQNVALHGHLFGKWAEELDNKVNDFIRGQSPRGPYVALHLRNGADWARACNLVEGSPLMFAAAQCLGYHKEHGSATKAMCTPSKDDIVRHARRAVKSTNATWIYVASDSDHMQDYLERVLKLRVVTSPTGSGPHFDLAVMGRANHFVGNCISSFTAFVKRERDVKGFPSTFFGFPPSRRRDEL